MICTDPAHSLLLVCVSSSWTPCVKILRLDVRVLIRNTRSTNHPDSVVCAQTIFTLTCSNSHRIHHTFGVSSTALFPNVFRVAAFESSGIRLLASSCVPRIGSQKSNAKSSVRDSNRESVTNFHRVVLL